jgi:hypothetical protein
METEAEYAYNIRPSRAVGKQPCFESSTNWPKSSRRRFIWLSLCTIMPRELALSDLDIHTKQMEVNKMVNIKN